MQLKVILYHIIGALTLPLGSSLLLCFVSIVDSVFESLTIFSAMQYTSMLQKKIATSATFVYIERSVYLHFKPPLFIV